MKILMQNSIFFPKVIGGAEIVTHLVGNELRRRGWRADAVGTTGVRGGPSLVSTHPTEDGLGTVFEAPSHGLCDIYGQDGVPDQPGFLVRGLHHFYSISSRRWSKIFTEILEQSKPDIVHTNNLVGMTPTIWAAANKKGIPVVHTLHDYHLLCPRTTLLRSDKSNCENPALPCRVLSKLKMRQTHQVEVVTAPSQFVLDRHLEAGGFSKARSLVVPNACEYLPPIVPERHSGGPIRGIFLCQLDEHKGILVLLDAIKGLFADSRWDKLRFDFAGAGPFEETVRNFCNSHPDRALFHGVVKGQQKFDLLAKANFQVVPSVWNDNFPLSILDGFSWGIPVIGTNRGGIPEVIRHEQDGLIIQPQSNELAQAMGKYLESEDLRKQHGSSARKRAENLTLGCQVDRFQDIYSSLCHNRNDLREISS